MLITRPLAKKYWSPPHSRSPARDGAALERRAPTQTLSKGAGAAAEGSVTKPVRSRLRISILICGKAD